MNVMKKLVSRAIVKMQDKSTEFEGEGKFVVEKDLMVFVGWKSEFAVGNTDYAFRTAITCSHAKVFNTREDALKASGQKEGSFLTDASDFFKREVEDAMKAMDFISFFELHDFHEAAQTKKL